MLRPFYLPFSSFFTQFDTVSSGIKTNYPIKKIKIAIKMIFYSNFEVLLVRLSKNK